MPTLYTMVAPCFFGTESTLNFEVKRLGAQNIQVTDGRVAFQGGADIIACLHLSSHRQSTWNRVVRVLALKACFVVLIFRCASNGVNSFHPFVNQLLATTFKSTRFAVYWVSGFQGVRHVLQNGRPEAGSLGYPAVATPRRHRCQPSRYPVRSDWH